MRTYNLFISHSWSHSEKYDGLLNLLNRKNYFRYKDYSVPKDDPIHTNGSDRELSEAIYRQMQPCSIVLILAGVYATYSKWIGKEIKLAKGKFDVPKPIIAIEYWGSERTSLVVKKNADRVVKWNTESIVSAIRKLTEAHEEGDGENSPDNVLRQLRKKPQHELTDAERKQGIIALLKKNDPNGMFRDD